MDFRRIQGLPPYVFTIIDGLKVEARRAGRDVVDLGFGNPDLPSPQIAVDKLAEAAHNTRNHRYSSSRGIPKLREAVADLYMRRFGVTLDPEREIISTIGAKEGFSHLMWVLLQPGDTAIVPTPSYPIHIWGPYFAGASTLQVPVGDGDDGSGYIDRVIEAWELGAPKPRVVVLSFPHNPTTTTVELADLQRLVDWARERDVALVHDLAYADMCFDGWQPPSIMQCEGAKEVAVELYSLTKSYSMAGWRVAFMVGRTDVIAALTQLKSYLDYGTFQPIQIAATVTLNEAHEYPAELSRIYESRRNALVDGLSRAGWEIHRPRGTMFAWARIPEPYAEMGSIEFATHLIRECDVAVSPGVGFGAGGDDFVRFALIENEHRIGQATRSIKRGLTRLQG
ncbi:alanine transaminase [Serinibacter arcticus]|uniref:Aminotransferase n=1 Tax=Serinibacter arcticus TaxID=1655435 RepID=A0A2U1ZYA1_9MICO|nr:aminotransferase class I/II-fold pyridoxal phosphate-dependent enzyme [Serinibacter arcticus]PWD51959.1 alanine transaminase [Serinibacter arcticus]